MASLKVTQNAAALKIEQEQKKAHVPTFETTKMLDRKVFKEESDGRP